MNQELKHAKIRMRTPRLGEPGTVDIVSESYVEELNTAEAQIEKSIMTSRASLATDILGCLREVTNGEALELDIKIIIDKPTGEPKRIIKTWTTQKNYYGKR